MKYLFLIEPKRRKAFCFQELGSPAIVNGCCVMHLDLYEEGCEYLGNVQMKAIHILHIMQSQNVRCSLQKSVGDTLKKNLPVAFYSCPKIWATWSQWRRLYGVYDLVSRGNSDSTGSTHLLHQRLSTLRTQWNLLGALLKKYSFLDWL